MRKIKNAAYSIGLVILILTACACGGDGKNGDVPDGDVSSDGASPNTGVASPNADGASPDEGNASSDADGAFPDEGNDSSNADGASPDERDPGDLKAENHPPINYTYEIVSTVSHDPGAFTQGLVVENGVFFESTGGYGRSTLRKVEIATGTVIQSVQLPDRYFGEGIAVFGDKIVQLTWKSGTGFVYDRDSFEVRRRFEYAGQGWGITHDGTRLIMSDGSSALRFLDPETFRQTGSIDVRDDKGPVVRLNELEFVRGEIFANVWQTDRIARIDPETGRVTGWIDLSGLLSVGEAKTADVLNGIAHDPDGDRLFVTGKLWPKLFEIRLLQSKTEG